MPIKYVHQERAVLTAAQKTKFVTFITGVWPGAAGDIDYAELKRDGAGGLEISISGTITVETPGELPDPPFTVEAVGSDFVYENTEVVPLNAAQEAAFIDFVTDTWTGVPSDVGRVTFTKVGSDIWAKFLGSKTVATVGDLPDGRLNILEIT